MSADEPRKRQRTCRPKDRPAYPRRRAVQACCTCRKRRTKCDNEQPACTSCVDLGIECFYEEKDKSTFDAASLAILQRLDTLEALVRTGNQISTRIQQAPEETSPLTTLKNLGSPALERETTANHYYINIETVLSWHVFHRHNLTGKLDLKHFLQSEHPRPLPIPISVSSDLETNGAELLQKFFENVHIYNPILEIATVKQYLRDAQFNGFAWDAQSCLLLLVYALGSVPTVHESTVLETSSSYRNSETCRKAEAFFGAAQKRMGSLLCHSGVVEAQCFFLAGVYLMATLRPIEAWKMFVQALACCQGFNTHDPTEEERQLQEGIYWTCFKSELELRLELNIANHRVWDLTYPSFFPSPPKDLKTQGEAAWYFYLAEIALRRLGNRILNYIYTNGLSDTSTADVVDAVMNFEQQATDWLSSLPPTLRLDQNVDEEGLNSSENEALRFILNGHLLDCYEMMYWPFIVEAINGRLSNDPESHRLAKKGLLICVQRIDRNESGFYQRHHGTWLMLRSCTRSALVLLGARLSGLPDLATLEWKGAVEKVIRMLRYWKDEAKDVPDRLDVLENLMRDVESITNSY
ncbi:C6 zinc finger domain-containing protein [Phlyctema vagabunda]|uniref:C6 zinc finger domain-containing protein n=1 Tax=Phlyctema vagabunda TaxID=108571 RepID=A0ABR4PH77_9HELO